VVCRTSEGKDTIAIDPGIAGKGFIQFFAPHAFYWVTPKAVYFSDDAHEPNFIKHAAL
jgi:hypothetical protein